MFHSARFKLTAWYLLIIMAISIAFSTFIYFGSTREFDRILRTQRYLINHPEARLRIFERSPQPDDPFTLDPEVMQEARNRVIASLVGINLIILIVSSVSGYFLAGLTLRPISDMMDEQNRFITDASHELNTPLTSLKTTIEVNMRDKNLTTSIAKEVFKSNLEEIDALQELSNSLIILTQYQKPNGSKVYEKVSLQDVIAIAARKLKMLAAKKQITFDSHIPNLLVMGDRKTLTELFVILLDNAIKYSPSKKSVEITGRKRDSKIEVTIKDFGRGISEEDMPYVFDRFYRADKARSKRIEGYGLGLSIAKRIAQLHDATITVTSKLNKGSEFIVSFPNTK